jgi:3-deoxy-7-phosphoheptulonate synthase
VEYATRLARSGEQRQDTLLPIMRVYFRESRAPAWAGKGLIYDPDLDGAGDIAKGLRAARACCWNAPRSKCPPPARSWTW